MANRHAAQCALFQFRPLATSRGVVGVAAFESKFSQEPHPAGDERLLTSILQQTAIAIDRSLLVGEAVNAAALEENKKLRTTLLSSLSHYLRTPLASSTAAAQSPAVRRRGACFLMRFSIPEQPRKGMAA